VANARINMPATAKRGEIIEIKTLVQHTMETGFRRTYLGVPHETEPDPDALASIRAALGL